MNMDREYLIDMFNSVVDKATFMAIQHRNPISLSKNTMLLGAISVEKNASGFYDIIKNNKTILYKDICVFDIAIIIAQRYNSRELSVIEQILRFECRYLKLHNDMIHYLHCMNIAKKKKDFQRLSILEDKFKIAEDSARGIKNKVLSFKRLK